MFHDSVDSFGKKVRFRGFAKHKTVSEMYTSKTLYGKKPYFQGHKLQYNIRLDAFEKKLGSRVLLPRVKTEQT